MLMKLINKYNFDTKICTYSHINILKYVNLAFPAIVYLTLINEDIRLNY